MAQRTLSNSSSRASVRRTLVVYVLDEFIEESLAKNNIGEKQ